MEQTYELEFKELPHSSKSIKLQLTIGPIFFTFHIVHTPYIAYMAVGAPNECICTSFLHFNLFLAVFRRSLHPASSDLVSRASGVSTPPCLSWHCSLQKFFFQDLNLTSHICFGGKIRQMYPSPSNDPAYYTYVQVCIQIHANTVPTNVCKHKSICIPTYKKTDIHKQHDITHLSIEIDKVRIQIIFDNLCVCLFVCVCVCVYVCVCVDVRARCYFKYSILQRA